MRCFAIIGWWNFLMMMFSVALQLNVWNCSLDNALMKSIAFFTTGKEIKSGFSIWKNGVVSWTIHSVTFPGSCGGNEISSFVLPSAYFLTLFNSFVVVSNFSGQQQLQLLNTLCSTIYFCCCYKGRITNAILSLDPIMACITSECMQ